MPRAGVELAQRAVGERAVAGLVAEGAAERDRDGEPAEALDQHLVGGRGLGARRLGLAAAGEVAEDDRRSPAPNTPARSRAVSSRSSR